MSQGVKECPLLAKYYVPQTKQNLEDWQRKLCLYCPLPWCIEDKRGRVSSLERKALEETVIGCPKCQSNPVVAGEIRQGDRLTSLRKSEDGWECIYCGLIIYKDKPRKKGGARK
jgi:hypothetical protein